LTAGSGRAFSRLQQRAKRQGFDLRIASSYRDYERQLAIFNGKVSGQRPVTDDHGLVLSRADCAALPWLLRILRFSALPGVSRHHWGSDCDVFDAARISRDSLQLVPREYDAQGPCGALSQWLTEQIERDDAEGFFRPYDRDRGGVAPEPWHLSYRPDAERFARFVNREEALMLWRGRLLHEVGKPTQAVALLATIEEHGEALWARFVVL
jgi:LAS superfamily LD-carboxypeptidase LdcB